MKYMSKESNQYVMKPKPIHYLWTQSKVDNQKLAGTNVNKLLKHNSIKTKACLNKRKHLLPRQVFGLPLCKTSSINSLYNICI